MYVRRDPPAIDEYQRLMVQLVPHSALPTQLSFAPAIAPLIILHRSSRPGLLDGHESWFSRNDLQRAGHFITTLLSTRQRQGQLILCPRVVALIYRDGPSLTRRSPVQTPRQTRGGNP
jgi:hypothetical protein